MAGNEFDLLGNVIAIAIVIAERSKIQDQDHFCPCRNGITKKSWNNKTTKGPCSCSARDFVSKVVLLAFLIQPGVRLPKLESIRLPHSLLLDVWIKDDLHGTILVDLFTFAHLYQVLLLQAGFELYSLLAMVMDGVSALAAPLFGMDVLPHFNSPWLATSTAQFWNTRWDLAAGNQLRSVSSWHS